MPTNTNAELKAKLCPGTHYRKFDRRKKVKLPRPMRQVVREARRRGMFSKLVNGPRRPSRGIDG